MANQDYSASEQIRALVNSVRGRVLRGHYEYEKDRRTAEKFRDQARALNDTTLETEVTNVLAIMDSFSGYFNSAVEQLQQNYEICHQVSDIGGMMLSMNNLAALHRKMGLTEEAMTFYDRGIQLVAEYAGQIEKHEISSYPQLLAGRLLTLVILGRHQEAQQAFDEVDALGEVLRSTDRLGYSRTMNYAYRGKAEIELSQQRIDGARAAIQRALELAQMLNLTFELAEVHLVQAHIALLGDNNPAEAERFWKRAEEIAATIMITFNTGCLLAEEARYLVRAGQRQKAAHFADIATELLNQTRTPEVEQVVRSLSAMVRGVA
jgi:tetratricopeptide (TPR) repeat protein